MFEMVAWRKQLRDGDWSVDFNEKGNGRMKFEDGTSAATVGNISLEQRVRLRVEEGLLQSDSTGKTDLVDGASVGLFAHRRPCHGRC